MWEVAKKENVTPTQMNLITFICEYPKRICTMSNLAKEFDLTQATVSEALSSLEKKGFIEREKGEDKRKFFLIPTSNGKEKYKLLNTWKDEFTNQLKNIEDFDKKELLKITTLLVNGFSKSKILSVARICIACKNLYNKDGILVCSITGMEKEIDNIDYGCELFSPEK